MEEMANLEGGEWPVLGIEGHVEAEVLGAELAPERLVVHGRAEARAGAGECRGGARAGLGDDRVQDESLQILQL